MASVTANSAELGGTDANVSARLSHVNQIHGPDGAEGFM